MYKLMFRPYSTRLDRLTEDQTDKHFEWVSAKAEKLAKALGSQTVGMDTFGVQTKLVQLLNRCPSLATVLENATMGRIMAALCLPVASKPELNTTLRAIDSLHTQLQDLLTKNTSNETIGLTLEQSTKNLLATGNLLGKISAKIKENPSNNDKLLDHTLAKWMSKGKELEFDEPVIYGVINPNQDKPDTKKQGVLDNLLTATKVDASGCEPNTPIVIRMSGNKDTFKEQILKPFRERLIVNTKVEVSQPGALTEDSKEIDLKVAPFIQTLENIICGNYDLVHKDIIALIDNADIFNASCTNMPEASEKLRQQFNHPDTETGKSLKRTMVARLLLPTMCLEGTSLSETARNLAVPTIAGLVIDIGKNYIPDKYGVLKTVLMQAFFLGVDAADNLAGAWPEVQSLLETLGIENVDYQSVFNETPPESDSAKALEFVKLALGLRSAEGEAGPAVATALRSAVLGTIFGNLCTTGYTLGIGALNLNPAFRAAIGIPAIVGTSLGIAINFAANHADLSMGYKKQIHDGTMEVPDAIKNSPTKLNEHCSDLATKQLMLLSGTGPATKAFTLAPLTSIFSLLGYIAPKKWVEAVFTPLMPGMENLVRLDAMSKHGDKVEKALDLIDEKVISQAAQGKSATMSKEEFEALLYGKVDKATANITLTIGNLFIGILGKRGHHTFQIKPNV